MKYWNDTLREMEEYIPGEQPEENAKIIKLNTNENPFPPSKNALDLMMKQVNENLRLYPDPMATRLREIFAEQNKLQSNQVFAGNGSDEIFTLIFRGFANKNSLAAFPYPSYSLYDTLAQGNGIPYEKVQLEEGFEYNLDKFLKKKYNLVIIANPNNPTGTFCPVEQIESFCKRFEGLFVVDEAYIDFYGGSAIELVNKFDNLIVTRSMSKSYSLAGLRVGFAAANADIIRGFMKIKDSYNLDSLAQAGACASLLDQKTFDYNKRMLLISKEYLEERLAEIDFQIIPSRANFIFVKHPQISAEDLYNSLKERGILVRYFSGERKNEYVRISIGKLDEVKKLCKEIDEIISE